MKKKRLMACLLAGTLAAGLLAGCGNGNTQNEGSEGSGSEGKTTIRFAWWGGQERADMTNEAVQLFMEKNPDIVVETSFYPYDSYYENLAIASTSDNLPDVFQSYIGSSELQQFQDGGLIEPLDTYVEDGLIDTSSISENLIAEGSVGDNLYGMPFGINTRAMVVNPEIYEQAGLEIPENGYESFEAMEADLAKIQEVTGKYASMDFFRHAGDGLKYYCRLQGETEFASEGDSLIGFSKETFVDFYTMRLKWAENGWIPPYDVTMAENGAEDSTLVKGESAVGVIPSNQFPNYEKAAGKDLQMILLPGASVSKATIVQAGAHLSIASTSKNKEAAAKLIDFLLNDEEANEILQTERGIPAADDIREAMTPSFDATTKKVSDIVDKALEYSSANDLPAMAGTSDIQKLIEEYEERIMYKDVTPEEAYDAIAEAASVN
ncbi:MAG TPA: ABC transporter substrate-binding protein [Candidatus Mediterraneibacter cottocaccae]|nr:ABC transporter substrate-binding protein [Candidatus Mediterraneibacter cottocaccae]